jgi:hypothetical protein
MGTRAALVAWLALALLPAWAAGDAYEIKVYPCAEAWERITVDGRLDEPSWQRAPLAGGFTYYDRPELISPQTFLRVVYDSRRVYFGILCDEPQMSGLACTPQPRDGTGVFQGETVELFIDPKHDNGYYQLAVSAAGSLYDSRLTDPSWNADARVAVSTGADQWTVELSIPWRDLGVEPRRGMVVGFNVCRDRYVGGARQWSNWSQTAANFHDPARFAHLVPSPTAERLARLGPEFRKGDRQGAVVVYGRQGFASSTYRALAAEALMGIARALGEMDAVAANEHDAAARGELTRRVGGYRTQVQELQAPLEGSASVDAAQWTRLDVQLQRVSRELSQAVWEARLAALFSTL